MLDGWTQATPEAVNDAGLVVGAAFAPETGFVAALWTPVGTEHTVTVLPLPDGANEGYPFDVDSGGTVVGCARGPGFVQAAVVWRSAAGAYGVPESLPGVPGSETGCATSANGLGWIAGWSGPVLPAVYRAVVWIPSAGGYEVRDLGILRGGIEFSQAWDLNDAGVVVGDSHAAHDHIEGFVWFHRLRSLGTLGGDTSSARAINDAGTIAGWSATSSGAVHAVLWRHGSRLDLGTLPAGDRSAANDVNDFGVVVGLSNAESFGPAHAVAWLPVAGRP
jgi:probable HAF family extracellular repeat protein